MDNYEYKIATVRVSGVSAQVVDRNPIPMGITGAVVEILYEDPLWAGLTKQVTFESAVAHEDTYSDSIIPFPAEVAAQQNVPVLVGITGKDDSGDLVIPTLWADIGTVRDSAYGEYPMPYEQLQQNVTALRQEVEELKNNPPSAAGTPGKSAYEYAQDGGYTGTEEEFAEKLAKELPKKLPNPKALSLTGAVSATYDGSEAVSVKIPQGGGEWKTIVDISLGEEVQEIIATEDVNGAPLAITDELILIACLLPNTAGAGSAYTVLRTHSGNDDIYGSGCTRADMAKGVPTTGKYYIYRHYKYNSALNRFVPTIIMESASTTLDCARIFASALFDDPTTKKIVPVDKIAFNAYAKMGVGSTIRIVGR